MRDYSFLKQYEFKKGQKPHNYVGLTNNCANCNKEFRVEPNQLTNGRGKNCSMKCYREFSKTFTGEKHHRWKGGKYGERRRLMGRIDYQLWRTAVFMRDNYTCKECGIKNQKGLGRRVFLEADHIKPWVLFPELRYAIDNGRTLCRECHRKTDTWGGRVFQGGTA